MRDTFNRAPISIDTFVDDLWFAVSRGTGIYGHRRTFGNGRTSAFNIALDGAGQTVKNLVFISGLT
jgi:hypothetical protein